MEMHCTTLVKTPESPGAGVSGSCEQTRVLGVEAGSL